jgi:hypothetical protein
MKLCDKDLRTYEIVGSLLFNIEDIIGPLVRKNKLNYVNESIICILFRMGNIFGKMYMDLL